MNKNIISILVVIVMIILIMSIYYVSNRTYANNLKISTEEEMSDYIFELWTKYEVENKNITKEQLIVVSLTAYESEVNNGGLCQFFVNSSRVYAPIISASLEKIGAINHKKIYDDFIEQNKIDVYNLDSFISTDVDEFIDQYSRFPFDDFDRKFYELEETETIYKLILEYAKNNYDKIFI